MMTRQEAAQLLGIDDLASKTDAKRAWRKQAMKHHPDRGGDVERMKLLNEANELWQNDGFSRFDFSIFTANTRPSAFSQYWPRTSAEWTEYFKQKGKERYEQEQRRAQEESRYSRDEAWRESQSRRADQDKPKRRRSRGPKINDYDYVGLSPTWNTAKAGSVWELIVNILLDYGTQTVASLVDRCMMSGWVKPNGGIPNEAFFRQTIRHRVFKRGDLEIVKE